jgi:hypothetical protein
MSYFLSGTVAEVIEATRPSMRGPTKQSREIIASLAGKGLASRGGVISRGGSLVRAGPRPKTHWANASVA